jgi:hypothetical protein
MNTKPASFTGTARLQVPQTKFLVALCISGYFSNTVGEFLKDIIFVVTLLAQLRNLQT